MLTKLAEKENTVTKATILIVDEDADLAASLKNTFEEEGYCCLVANDGHSAITLCKENSINLTVTDTNLPDIPAVELIEKLRKTSPRTEHILISAFASLETVMAAIKQDKIAAFYPKPFKTRPLLGLIKQVIERQQAQQTANRNEALYRLLAENVADVIWLSDLKLNFNYLSPSVTSLFGYTPQKVDLVFLQEMLTPDSRNVLEQALPLIEQGTSTKISSSLILELEFFRKDGSTVWTESRVRILYDDEGKATGLLGVTRDINDRKRTEENLHLSEAKLTRAQRIAHLGSWDWDLVKDEIYCSDEIARICALDPRNPHITYEMFLNAIHPDDREVVRKALNDAIKEKKPYQMDYRILLPDNSIGFIHEKAEITYARGKPVRIAGTILDVTERKRVEEELRSLSQRLVQIQEEERRSIARDLHDQIAQSLAVLKLILDKVVRSPEIDPKTAIMEAQKIITELIAFVRNISLDLRPTMLDDLGLLPTLFWHFDRYTAQTQIKVDFKHAGLDRYFHPDTGIAAYRIIQEVLNNVARHAHVEEVSVRAWANLTLLSLRIEDKGTGFQPDSLAAGSSNGLRGMRERVRAIIGGKITIESAPGKGTIVTAELPIS